jgi:hypothetical protein
MAHISKQEMFRDFSTELQNGDAALFVGAGLSKPSGFVDWKELLRDVAEELHLEIERESDLVALAQYHVNERKGRDRLNRLLIEEFTKDAKLTENHGLIATLPLDTIWTTNYDQLLETAVRQMHRRPAIITSQENFACPIPNHDVAVMKMHGDIGQPHDAVLTKDDYEAYEEKRGVFSTALKGDLVKKTFLFLGFSFTDPNIDYILSRIRGLLGQNQRTHYCIMKWPDTPKESTGKARADADYQRRKLELRVADLSRYRINAVMIDAYDEITEILRELNRRSHMKHIFVSGSAHEYGPLGKERLMKFCSRMGIEIVRRGFNLVSGFGREVGGAVTLGALELIYAESLSTRRLLLFPFPVSTDEAMKATLVTQYRTSMLSNAGFAFFICGNREDSGKGTIVAPGVMQEFDLACQLGKVPVPLGASGWAAREIWSKVSAMPKLYFGTKDVSAELKVLGEEGKSDDEYVAAMFGIVREMTR